MDYFTFFTNANRQEIYIDDRGGRVNRYAVIHNGSIVDEFLTKRDAVRVAKSCLKEAESEE